MATPRTALRVERLTERAGVCVFRLAGRLDVDTVDELRRAVGHAIERGGDVLLDVSALDACDSAGVAAVVSLHRSAAAACGRLVLCAPPPPVRDILRTTGVDRVVPVLPSSALAGIRRRAGRDRARHTAGATRPGGG